MVIEIACDIVLLGSNLNTKEGYLKLKDNGGLIIYIEKTKFLFILTLYHWV